VSAVTRSERCPTCSPILAHGTPDKCKSEILRCRRSCGENAGTAAARDRGAEGIAAKALEDAPDLVLVRPPRLIFAELKSESGQVRANQTEWLDVLRLLPAAETYLWRPSDWDEPVEVLTGAAPRKAA
jgi:hypothetical protein